ncbi:MAG TPA: hypothetical protein VMX77_01720 [Candidatus Bathyarchaeia archaeon]|nr:hypothetical protein [Candidatus Bathyarchaeia archaeon]
MSDPEKGKITHRYWQLVLVPALVNGVMAKVKRAVPKDPYTLRLEKTSRDESQPPPQAPRPELAQNE